MNASYNALIELAAWLSQTAFNLFIQSTLLISVGLLAAFLLRRNGSAVQSAIYRATLIAVLACPLATIFICQLGYDGWSVRLPETTRIVMMAKAPPNSPLPIPPTESTPLLDQTIDFSTTPILTPAGGKDLEPESIAAPSVPTIPEMVSESADSKEIQLVTEPIMVEQTLPNTSWIVAYALFGLVWLVGAFVFHVGLILAYRKLNRIRRRSVKATEIEQILCGQLAKSINVRTPDVRRNSLLFSPCLTGITSPTILLPDEIRGQVPLEKAFAHELAHLRRHDTLWNLIQRVALALFFYQPLLWRLVYRLETTSEEVCDDYVVRHCTDRAGYARQLVDLAESGLLAPNMAGLGMFSSKSTLGHRIARILDSTRTLTTQISSPVVVCIASLAIVCATLGGFLGNDKSLLTVFNSGAEISESTPPEESDPLITFSGRVLDPEGSPVANATVGVFPGVSVTTTNQNPPAYTTTTSQSDGTFEVRILKSSLIISGTGFYPREKNYCLVASAIGFGINWIDADELEDMAIGKTEGEDLVFRPVDIRLTNDTTKTKLQLIDPEGSPISDARARITRVSRFANEDISPFYDAHSPGEIYSQRSSSDDLIIHGLPDYSANENGELVMDGLGNNRIIQLEITGPEIAIRVIRVATTEAETVSVSYGGMHAVKQTTYGATSTIACEPSQPIAGRVFDRESKQPLAGVKIMSSKFAGEKIAGMRLLQTETDEEGRFRLTGMPKGPGNTIIAVPNDEQPYFMLRFKVPAASGLDSVQMDLPLQCGIFIRGKATDLKTGDPVAGATLHYLPFLSNETAAASPVFGDEQFMEIQDRYLTGSDGSFQLVGFPGRGVVGIDINEGFYPTGMGWEDIPKEEKSDDDYGEVKTFRYPICPSRMWPTAMMQVQVPENQTEHFIEFQLHSGLSIPVKITDGNDHPLTGVEVSRLRSSDDHSYITTTPIVNATAFSKNETRLLKFVHPAKSLSRVVELSAAVLNSAGKINEPVQIKLLPDSMVTGKLVDGNGDAIVHGEIRFDIGGSRHFGMALSTVTTDKEGRFAMNHVPSGTHYSISVSTADNIFGVNDHLHVEAGERIDLGTIDVTSSERPEPIRTVMESDQQSAPANDGNPESAATTKGTGDKNNIAPAGEANRVIRGIVSDENGSPVSGASVRFSSWTYKPNFELTILAETLSNADGRFELEIDKQKLDQLGAPDSKKVYAGVIVRADGYGSVQSSWTDNPDNEPLKISLPVENRLAGRVVDLEGNPVVGAKVHFTYAMHFGKQSADRFLTLLRRTGRMNSFREVYLKHQNDTIDGLTGAIEPLVETNQNGEFEFRGIPGDSLVNLRVEHPQIVSQIISALARPIETVDADPQYIVFGDHPLIVTQPCRPIVGKVVDSKTGEPIANTTILCTTLGIRDTSFWSSPAPRTVTDEDGQFELLGVPKSDLTELTFFAPKDQPWLIKEIRDIPDTVGLEPVDLVVELHRGIWITGQVTDRLTGQGVQAEMVYFPMRDNPHLDGISGFQTGYSIDLHNAFQHFDTDDRGNFRIPGLPGRAVLGAQVASQDYRSAHGYEKVLNEFGTEYTQQQIDDSRMRGSDLRGKKYLDVRVLSYVWRGQFGSTFIGIDPPAGTDEVVQNLQMDPGYDVSIRVVDTDGKPVERFTVSRSDGFYGKGEFSDGACTISKMGEDEIRWVTIQAIGRPIGTIVEIKGVSGSQPAAMEKQTVTLEPYGTIRGKLVDKDNKPLEFYSVDARYGGKTTTNAKGEFKIGDVIANQKLILGITAPGKNEYHEFVPHKEMEPGKTLDLGKINVDELGEMIISGLAG